jgi:hypothetical protein
VQPTLAGGFVVSEYLVGADMGQVLRAQGPLSIQEAVD